jgi:hypothetical protein
MGTRWYRNHRRRVAKSVDTSLATPKLCRCDVVDDDDLGPVDRDDLRDLGDD